MKALKIILLIIWAFLTIGLTMYSQMLKVEAECQRLISNETYEMLTELTKGLTEYYENMNLLRNDSLNKVDIDSLFESSLYLTKYEEKIKEYKME